MTRRMSAFCSAYEAEADIDIRASASCEVQHTLALDGLVSRAKRDSKSVDVAQWS
jgi:hypothetical protein